METKVGSVIQLWRYPISSLAGEAIPRSRFDLSGIEGDRVGALHEVETGNIIFPSVVRKWNIAPRMAARTGSSGSMSISLDGKTWGTLGDEVLSRNLKNYCGTDLEFRRYDATTAERQSKQRYDFSPVHVISTQALESLKSILPDSDIVAERFRPNLIVDLPSLDGRCPEYRLIGKEFTIGGVKLRGVRASGRCSFTTLAQRELADDPAILRALIKHFDKNFGIYCEVVEAGEAACGDDVSFVHAEKPIVIVGAGQAGAQVAINLRDLGSKQSIKLFGDEPQAPYERPPLSKHDAPLSPSYVIAPDDYDRLGIELLVGTNITQIDTETREIVSDDGSRHQFDRLILATGGRARTLHEGPHDDPRIHYLRTFDDASRLYPLLNAGTRVAIIGTGWLGLEMSAVARLHGCDVTVYGRQNRILARSVPPAVAEFVQRRHLSEGVNFQLNSDIDTTLDVSSIDADVIVVAIGILPNDHIGQAAGLEVNDGVLVDTVGATSTASIYAIGDVARERDASGTKGRRLESWHSANDQALALARHLMFLPKQHAPVPRFWSTQFDMTIQIVGLPDPDAVPVAVEDGVAPLWDFGSFIVGINRPRDIRRATKRLSGALTQREVPSDQRSVHAQPIGPSRLVKIGSLDEIGSGPLVKINNPELGNLLVAKVDGEFRVTSDLCPHAEASLSEGFIEGDRIVCPVHFAEFDLRTGQPFNAPPGCDHLQCFKVIHDGEDLFIEVQVSDIE